VTGTQEFYASHALTTGIRSYILR